MRFKIQPIEIIQAPNYYSILPDNQWILYDESSASLSFMLKIEDSLGERPYLVSNSDTLTSEFPRSDSLAIQSGTRGTISATSRSVTKTCNMDTDNKSLFTMNLSSTDISNIISGSVKFTLQYGSTTRTWLENYIIIKKINDVGL